MQTLKPLSDRMLIATAALTFGLALAGPAAAVPPMFGDDTATYSGQKLLEQTAFNPSVAPNGLETSGRSAISADLTKLRQTLADDTKTLGAAKSVRLAEETHFIGCIMARYRINYASGSRYWLLHFRHSSQGLLLDSVVPLEG